MTVHPLAEAYVKSFGSSLSHEGKIRVYKAVMHGLSLVGLQRKPIGDPVQDKAFKYAQSIDGLVMEEKFKIQQAVLHGHSIIGKYNPQMSTENNQTFTDNTPMPFGKHKGKAMANIPAPYFLWLLNEGCSHAGVKQYILSNLEGLKQEADKSKVRY
ncbi:MAG: DUF3820 family protein [Chitinophagia bacterium]